MEDSIQQYIKAAEDLRELVQEAHAVLKDLRTERQAIRSEIKEYETKWIAEAHVRVTEAREQIFAEIAGGILQDFVKTVETTGNVMNRAAKKHADLIASSAETLALAIRERDAAAAARVAAIAKKTSRSIERKIV